MMLIISFLFTLALSILPVYLVGLYVYKKDKEKEPKKLLTKLFVLGMFSCIPAAFIEVWIEAFFNLSFNSSLTELFIYVALGIAFVEEICKWSIVYLVAYNNKEFNHIYDAIVYCVFVSLGFACFENIFYVFSANSIKVGILRAITAIPGHACDAVIMANYLGLAKINEYKNNKYAFTLNMFLSIAMPTLIHTIYDYCLVTNRMIFLVLFLLFLIFIYIFSIRKIKKLSEVDNNIL